MKKLTVHDKLFRVLSWQRLFCTSPIGYKVFFSLILLLVAENLTGQTIQGIVLDADNGQPIEGASVLELPGQQRGTITDSLGRWSLQLGPATTSLQIRFLGYTPQQIRWADNTVDTFFTIRLQPSSTLLPEVSVSASVQVDTLTSRAQSIRDYVLYGDYLITLGYRNALQGWHLSVFDRYTGELQYENPLDGFRAKRLWKTCTGQIFIFSSYNAYPLLLTDGGWSIGQPKVLEDFPERLHRCHWATEQYLFLENFFYQGQALQYVGVPRLADSSKAPIFLPRLEHENNIVLLFDEAGVDLPWSGDYWEDPATFGNLSLRHGAYQAGGWWGLFYPKLFAPLVALDSQLVLVDHHNGSISYFSLQGDSLKQVPFRHHQQKSWEGSFLFDPVTSKGFTSFREKGSTLIVELDLQTGMLKEGLLIPFSFFENVKVYDNELYLLYWHPGRGERHKILYRVRL